MIIRQNERILMHILSCGPTDLKLLDNINYDLDDIIDDLMLKKDLSINSIFREVFFKGAKDLKDALDEHLNDTIEEINDEIIAWKEKSGDDYDYDNDDDFQELLEDLELAKNGDLDPEDGLDCYCNCLDTHVYMKHIDFYRRWMKKDVDDIEYNMGFEFRER